MSGEGDEFDERTIEEPTYMGAAPEPRCRFGEVLLLEPGDACRALRLVDGAALPALVHLSSGGFSGERALFARASLALADIVRGPAVLAPFAAGRFDLATDDPFGGRTFLAHAHAPGAGLLELLRALSARGASTDFPVEVALHVALAVAAVEPWGDFGPEPGQTHIDWEGRVWRAARLSHASWRFRAPEEVRGGAPTRASGVYRVGTLLHWLLAGAHPDDQRVPSIAARRPELSRAAVQALDAAQAGESAARPASVGEIVSACGGAADESAARRFLAGLLAATFGERRAGDLAFWEEAQAMNVDVDEAPFEPLAPALDRADVLTAFDRATDRLWITQRED